MIKFFIYIVALLGTLIFLPSCNKNIENSSELQKRSQTNDAIIDRSGTTFRAGSNKSDLKRQMADAQNRLRTGGGLLGKKSLSIGDIGKDNEQTTVASVGLPINPYLWKGSLETISFMPLASADPFSGIIITDWYSGPSNPSERCKLNIFVKGIDFKANNLQVNSFCQTLNNDGNWIDKQVDINNNNKLENAILNKAKKIRLSQS